MDHLAPKPGDLLVFNDVVYCRWAVYVGEDKVIHVTAEGAVKEEQLKVSESIVTFTHVDNTFDSQVKPFTPDEIIERARSKVGQPWSFDLFSNNSEHFAKWCRYDTAICQQVPYAYDTGDSAGAGVGSVTLGPARVHFPSVHKKDVNEEGNREIEVGTQLLGAEVGFLRAGIGPTIRGGTRKGTNGSGFTGEIGLAEVRAGPVGVSAGLGVSTGFQNDERNFTAKVLGTGVDIRKKENGEGVEGVGVSVLGSKVECSVM
ncbi:hypothetical protein FO519_006957 [Halicephalobus sp. NKZ332]|nr:hypothetical protein FO519_006957 [Halicephalobus sp. NKZ332]